MTTGCLDGLCARCHDIFFENSNETDEIISGNDTNDIQNAAASRSMVIQ